MPTIARRAAASTTARRASTRPLSSDALAALEGARCPAPDRLILPDALPLAVYTEVDEALGRCGGAWHTGHRAHVFPGPLAASTRAWLITHGVMPEKNPTAFFPTPADLVAQMCEEADLAAYAGRHEYAATPKRCLEPSAGTGAIARAIRAIVPDARDLVLETVEALDVNAAALRAQGFSVAEQDFLTFTPSAPYDLILMNPPFSLPGQPRAWETHLRHAFGMLGPGGTLVAILPASAVARPQTASAAASRAWLGHYATHIEAIPAGAFRESGTQVATVLVTMVNRPHGGRLPYGDGHCWQCTTFALWAENDWATSTRLEHAATASRATQDALLTELAAVGDETGRFYVLESTCLTSLHERWWAPDAPRPMGEPAEDEPGIPAVPMEQAPALPPTAPTLSPSAGAQLALF